MTTPVQLTYTGATVDTLLTNLQNHNGRQLETIGLTIADDFHRPNTTTGSIGTAVSGNTWELRRDGYTVVTDRGTIQNNKFECAEGSTVYAVAVSPVTISKIGFRVSFSAGTGAANTGVAAFGVTPDNTINNLGIHFTLTPSLWQLQTRTSGGEFVTVVEGAISPALVADGTEYDFEVSLNGANATITAAGVQSTGTSAAFVTLAGKYVFFEHYYNAATVLTKPSIHAVWAGVATPAPLPQNVATTSSPTFSNITVSNVEKFVDSANSYISDTTNVIGALSSTHKLYIRGGTGNAGNPGLALQDNALSSISMFASCTEGLTKELIITGWRTGSVSRQLEIGVGIDAINTASFDGLAYYLFDGRVIANTGFLPTPMSTETRDAISPVSEGLIIYNITTHKLNFYNGTAWETVTSGVI